MKKKLLLGLLCCLLISVMGLAACGGDTGVAVDQNPIAIAGVPETVYVGDKFSLSTAGGSGNGAVTYAIVSGDAISLEGELVTAEKVGSAVVKATKAAVAGLYNATSSQVTIEVIAKAQSGFAISDIGRAYGDAPFTLQTTGGQGTGAVTFSKVSGDGVTITAEGLVTISAVGDFTVKATKAGDGTYAEASVTRTLTIAKGVQNELTIVKPSADYFVKGETTQLSATGGSTAGAITYTLVEGSATVSSSGNVTFTHAGTVAITATMAGNGNYNATTSERIVIYVKDTQSTLALVASEGSFATARYGETITVETTGGSGEGEITYSVVSGPATVDENGVVSFTGVGAVSLKATKAADDVYVEDFDIQSFTVLKGLQNNFAITNPGAKKFKDADFTLATTGKLSDGAATFSKVSGGVTITSAGKVTITAAGTAVISATAPESDLYEAKTVEITIEIGKATQAALNIAAVTGITVDSANFTLATTGGSGSGAITYEIVTGEGLATVTNAGVVDPIKGGSVTIRATKAGGNDYNDITKDITFTIAKRDQASVGIDNIGTLTYGDAPITLSAFGGSTLNNFTFSSSNANIASVSGNQLVIKTAGTVTITATKAGDDYYKDISTTVQVSIDKLDQSNAVVLTNDDATGKKVGETVQFYAAGGDGTGAFSFKVLPAKDTGGNFVLTNEGEYTYRATIDASGLLTIKEVGTIEVVAIRAASTNYNEATSNTISFSVSSKGTQSELVIGNIANLKAGGTYAIPVTGGNGEGIVTFAVTTGLNTIARIVGTGADQKLEVLSAGTFVVTARKGDDANYEQGALVSREFTAGKGTLAAPVITVDNAGTISWAAVTGATGYNVYLNGELLTETSLDNATFSYPIPAAFGKVRVEAIGDDIDFTNSFAERDVYFAAFPSISGVSISSNNAIAGTVAVGDTVTLTFVSSEAVVATGNFELLGKTDLTLTRKTGTDLFIYSVSVVVDETMLGIIHAANDASDLFYISVTSPLNDQEIIVTAVNDGSMLEVAAPLVTSITVEASRGNNKVYIGDEVVLTFTTNQEINLGDIELLGSTVAFTQKQDGEGNPIPLTYVSDAITIEDPFDPNATNASLFLGIFAQLLGEGFIIEDYCSIIVTSTAYGKTSIEYTKLTSGSLKADYSQTLELAAGMLDDGFAAIDTLVQDADYIDNFVALVEEFEAVIAGYNAVYRADELALIAALVTKVNVTSFKGISDIIAEYRKDVNALVAERDAWTELDTLYSVIPTSTTAYTIAGDEETIIALRALVNRLTKDFTSEQITKILDSSTYTGTLEALSAEIKVFEDFAAEMREVPASLKKITDKLPIMSETDTDGNVTYKVDTKLLVAATHQSQVTKLENALTALSYTAGQIADIDALLTYSIATQNTFVKTAKKFFSDRTAIANELKARYDAAPSASTVTIADEAKIVSLRAQITLIEETYAPEAIEEVLVLSGINLNYAALLGNISGREAALAQKIVIAELNALLAKMPATVAATTIADEADILALNDLVAEIAENFDTVGANKIVAGSTLAANTLAQLQTYIGGFVEKAAVLRYADTLSIIESGLNKDYFSTKNWEWTSARLTEIKDAFDGATSVAGLADLAEFEQVVNTLRTAGWEASITTGEGQSAVTIKYETFTEAVTEANAGNTVKLGKNLTITRSYTISKAIIIDGDNHTVGFGNISYVPQADQYAFVVIQQNVTFKNITFRHGNAGVLVTLGANVTLSGTVVFEANSEAGVVADKDSKVTISATATTVSFTGATPYLPLIIARNATAGAVTGGSLVSSSIGADAWYREAMAFADDFASLDAAVKGTATHVVLLSSIHLASAEQITIARNLTLLGNRRSIVATANYALKVVGAAGVTVNISDIVLAGGVAGLFVDTSTVVLTGNVNILGGTKTGIEINKGTLTSTDADLSIELTSKLPQIIITAEAGGTLTEYASFVESVAQGTANNEKWYHLDTAFVSTKDALLAAAIAGHNIILTANITLADGDAGAFVIINSLTLDGNGKKIGFGAAYQGDAQNTPIILKVVGAIEVVVKDIEFTYGGTAVVIASGATVNLQGTVKVSGAAYGAFVIDDSILNFGTATFTYTRTTAEYPVIVTTGEGAQVNDSKLIVSYVEDGGVNYVWYHEKIAFVASVADLKAAIVARAETIVLQNDIKLGLADRIVFEYKVTIKGEGKTISYPDSLENANWLTSDPLNVIQVNSKADVTIENLTLANGNIGLFINGGKVTLKGDVVVEGNRFAGIRVSGAATLTLTAAVAGPNPINAATFTYDRINPDETPVIWVDGTTATITGFTSLVKSTVSVGAWYHESRVFANSLKSFNDALATDKTHIYLTGDITLAADDRLVIARAVTVVGNGFTIASTTNTAWVSGKYVIQVYGDIAVTLENLTLKNGNAGLLVNGSDVTLSGDVTIEGGSFGGIEIDKNGELIIGGGANVTFKLGSDSIPQIWTDGTDGTVTGGAFVKSAGQGAKKDQDWYHEEITYANTKAQLLAAVSEGHIVLTADIALGDAEVVAFTANAILDGANFKLGFAAKNGAGVTGRYVIKATGTSGTPIDVTIKNVKLAFGNAGIQVGAYASVTVAGTVTSDAADTAIIVEAGGTLDVSDATITFTRDNKDLPVIIDNNAISAVTGSKLVVSTKQGTSSNQIWHHENIAFVADAASLLAAIKAKVATIVLSANIELGANDRVIVDYTLTIRGNGKTLGYAAAQASANWPAANAVDDDDNPIQPLAVIQVSAKGVLTLQGAVTLSNGNVGIFVNGGKATVKGAITINGNKYGGILVANKGTLTIDAAATITFTGTTGLPTIWSDATTGTVTGYETGFVKTEKQGAKQDEIHYTPKPANPA